ncbi:MAG: hypothetical protein LBF62_07140 [Tannerellaceae bacterium]|nr:hypothetical protein [Tannerellaceae bacterium]
MVTKRFFPGKPDSPAVKGRALGASPAGAAGIGLSAASPPPPFDRRQSLPAVVVRAFRYNPLRGCAILPSPCKWTGGGRHVVMWGHTLSLSAGTYYHYQPVHNVIISRYISSLSAGRCCRYVEADNGEASLALQTGRRGDWGRMAQPRKGLQRKARPPPQRGMRPKLLLLHTTKGGGGCYLIPDAQRGGKFMYVDGVKSLEG